MPWQQLTADVALEVVDDPRSPRGWSWAYRIVVVTVPRQAGKTTLLGPVNHQRGLTMPDAKMWLTAQTRQDARDTWGDVAQRIAKSPLAEHVKVRRSNGSESLTYPSGSTFRVFAPSEDALHGKANELVSVDEVWAFDAAKGAALEQAILPTFTTTGGQLWLVSTAGTAASAWLRGFVERGRAAVDDGRRDTICYVEWSLDDDQAQLVAAGLGDDASPEDRRHAFDVVLANHPAAGHTLRDTTPLEQAAATMSVGDFLRAYGNVWTATADRVIPEHLWAARLADSWPVPAGEVGLSYEVALDRSEAAIVAAWRDVDTGPLRVDVVEAHPGDSWVADRVVELRDRWRLRAIAHNASGPSLDVADELRRRGVDSTPINTRDWVAACAAFLSAVRNARMAHRGQPALDDAVAAAAQRPLGDGWAWAARLSAGSIAALSAATGACWAYEHRPAPAARPVIASRARGRVSQPVRRRPAA